MHTFEIILTSIVLVAFGLFFLLAVLRWRSKQAAVFLLMLYAGLGLLSTLSRLLNVLKVSGLPDATHTSLNEFSLLAMMISFGGLSLIFLKKGKNGIIAYGSGALVIFFLWAASTFNWQPLAYGWSAFDAALTFSILGWLGPILTVFAVLTSEFKKQQSAKHRNRLRYWLIATALLSASGLIRFINPDVFYWTGLPFIAAGTLLAGYVVLSYHTPDLNLFVGWVLYNLGLTGSIAAFFYFSLAFTVVISRNAPNLIVFLWSVILATLLALTMPVTQQFLNQLLTRAIFGNRYRDAKQVIKYYSQSLSGALDMQRLANTIINLMVETLPIKQGVVFVNERDENDPNRFSFRPLASIGFTHLSAGCFTISSPFAEHFRKGQKLLHQYDMDVRPEFSLLNDDERAWLAATKLELYVPILRHRELVGLLGFGSRAQGTTYPAEEVDLMIALADQAALAMDSARLFDQLTTTNQEKGSLREQLAGLDKNKADFLSIASHELRTPLTHIHGYSKILFDFTEAELQNTAQVKAIVEAIVKGSERMKNVIDVMFDVSEVNVGDLTLFSGPVNLENVIDQAVRPYLSSLDQRRIAFAKKGFEGAPIVEADGTRLVQAFENLISNAIKYTPDGGMITVSCRTRVEDNLGQVIEISVADTGIGIDPKHQQRVFDKFYRIDDTDHHSTSKTKFKGSGPGLGLTLVKGIAEAHGGRVWVESQGYDETNCPGSKFFVVIPLHPIPQTPEDIQKQYQIKTIHWHSRDMKAGNNH
jgi:signal transduction histidine kinase